MSFWKCYVFDYCNHTAITIQMKTLRQVSSVSLGYFTPIYWKISAWWGLEYTYKEPQTCLHLALRVWLLDYGWSHEFNRIFYMNFFDKIHDMNWEKLWILSELVWSDPYVNGFSTLNNVMQRKHHTSPHVGRFHCYSTIHARRHDSLLEGDAWTSNSCHVFASIIAATLPIEAFQKLPLENEERLNFKRKDELTRCFQTTGTLRKVKPNAPKKRTDFGLYWPVYHSVMKPQLAHISISN